MRLLYFKQVRRLTTERNKCASRASSPLARQLSCACLTHRVDHLRSRRRPTPRASASREALSNARWQPCVRSAQHPPRPRIAPRPRPMKATSAHRMTSHSLQSDRRVRTSRSVPTANGCCIYIDLRRSHQWRSSREKKLSSRVCASMPCKTVVVAWVTKQSFLSVRCRRRRRKSGRLRTLQDTRLGRC
jgi:hypothetical protein